MLVVDNKDCMVVVDSRNHRLQVFDSDMTFVGMVEVELKWLYLFLHSCFVQVDIPLTRPSGIYMDHESMNIFVTNYAGKSLVKYKMSPSL